MFHYSFNLYLCCVLTVFFLLSRFSKKSFWYIWVFFLSFLVENAKWFLTGFKFISYYFFCVWLTNMTLWWLFWNLVFYINFQWNIQYITSLFDQIDWITNMLFYEWIHKLDFNWKTCWVLSLAVFIYFWKYFKNINSYNNLSIFVLIMENNV